MSPSVILFISWLGYAGLLARNFSKIRDRWRMRTQRHALQLGITFLFTSAVLAFGGVYLIANSAPAPRFTSPTLAQWIWLDLLGIAFVHLQGYGMIVIMGRAFKADVSSAPNLLNCIPVTKSEPSNTDTVPKPSHSIGKSGQ